MNLPLNFEISSFMETAREASRSHAVKQAKLTVHVWFNPKKCILLADR